MKLIRSIAEWNPHWLNHLQKSQKIGLVPTMGALHQGHLDLVGKSKVMMDVTVVSIFVNPTQFNNPEDFKKYPITLEADLEKLKESGTDYVFVPSVETMYPNQTRLTLDFGDLERVLEGKFRPGHFNGVGTVVSKLFHIIKPHIAFFGQKDLQQVAIINRLVQDLSFDLHLEVVPTRREMDGLAMSSRNLRLNDEERKKALLLFESMNQAKNRLLEGQAWREVKESVRINFEREKHTQLEYFELVNPDSFALYGEFNSEQKSSICIAAFVGEVRLIDNLPIIP
ncbi:pantoate--beta-alanine ligase [Algoriphagus sp. AK58]|uniref:pantoate--beta-alanine ligase n=1 Tax=Algoriphagus sp. AK58 TaxID=1406877 RepID=UPI00164F897E|nr:pantoate--beta-alanine ligase [Algoriphagus sp. AK58]